MAEAGFDLTEISATVWQRMIDGFGLSFEESSEGWVWSRYRDLEGERDFVISANNPITGEYHSGGRGKEVDYASYIGISGSDAFVKDAFEYIKEHADYIKASNPKHRHYI